MTLAETAAADGSGEGSSPTGASQAQVGGSGETSTATELDTKKLVQVCLLSDSRALPGSGYAGMCAL